MSWLTPAAAIIAASIAVPSLIILYFLKLRRRELDVSTTLLWKKAIQDLQANAPFQRLRKNILLLLQLLILAAALIAIGQPMLRTAASPGSRIVVMIDRSASMDARDESEAGNSRGPVLSRLDKAKQEARKAVEAMRAPSLLGVSEPDEAMVIAFDSAAEVVQPFTGDKTRLLAAIDSIEATDAPGSISEAMRLAGAYARPVMQESRGLIIAPGPPIELFSDGALADLASVSIPPETDIRYHAMGRPKSANYAITAMRAERSYDNPGEVSIFVGLQSSDPAEKSVDVELTVDGVVSAAKSVKFPGAPEETGESATGLVFRLNQTQGATIAARITAGDVLAADNTARIVLPPAKRVAVAVVGEGDLFLASALEALPLSKRETLTPAQYQNLVTGGKTDDFDIYIFSGWSPASPAAPKEGSPLPPGRYLFFGAVPPFPGLTGATPAEPQADVIIDWDRRHPALNLISLANLVMSNPMTIRAGEGVTVLAHASRGPAIVEVNRSGARAIIVGFDPLESNWPFEADFILFLATSIRYLADDFSSIAAETLIPGRTLSERLPLGARDASITLPDSTRTRLTPASDGLITFGPLRRVGVYSLSWSGPARPDDAVVSGSPTRTIPVNLFDPLESAVESRGTLSLPTGDVQAVNRDASTGARLAERQTERPLWTWCLLGALAVMLFEWFIYHRRVRI